MKKNYVHAKIKQAALFIPRIVLLTIDRKTQNQILREEGFVLSRNLNPLQLHRFYFKVYSDGTSGF